MNTPAIQHCVLTNNRTVELFATVNSILQYASARDVKIYDSGGRDEIESYCRELSIKYFDTSFTTNAYENFIEVLNSNHCPIFIHHDDDLVVSEIVKVKDEITKKKIKYLCCLKYSMKSLAPSNSPGPVKFGLEELLSLYFLDPRKNCPLVTGLFIDNTDPVAFRANYQYPGIYADVGIICDLISRDGGFVWPNPYILYNDFSSGENSIHRPHDKAALGNFLKNISPLNGDFYSFLCCWREKSMYDVVTWVVGSLWSHPYLTLALLKKATFRWRR